MDLAPQLLDSRGDPAALERLYRGDAAGFSAAFPAVFAQHPDSGILQAWQARLHYDEPSLAAAAAVEVKPLPFAWVFRVAFAAAVLTKLPALFSSAVQEFVYPRDTAFFILGPLAVYFALARRPGWCTVRLAAGVFALAALFINVLPGHPSQNGFTLACVHLPLLLGWITCVVYLGPSWRDLSARAELIRLVGEAIVYTALVLLTGMVLTAVTLGLFAAVHLQSIVEFYTQWIAVMGAAAAPVVGLHLAFQRLHGKALIAPLLARIISPLVLITLVVYLASLLPNLHALYSDRDFLIAFNLMSVGVLAIAAFGLCAWPTRSWLDHVLLGLLALALLIDLTALSAILCRLNWYGLSVNRLAVLGANALLTVHLAGLLYYFARGLFFTSDLAPARRWLLRYLPVYTAWTALVVFLFPILGLWLD